MRLLHVISIILLLSYTSASKIEFDRYTIDDGLSQNTVYKVFQDSRGYIWLGTQGGLDRFNGYEFKGTPVATIISGKIKMKEGIHRCVDYAKKTQGEFT